MTISPPANVKTDTLGIEKILSSGVDTLELAVYVLWKSTSPFTYFDRLKDTARENNADCPGEITAPDEDPWRFSVKPHGTNGYAWILVSHEYSVTVGKWVNPMTRPSMMVTLRSEVLWRLGVDRAVSRILTLISSLDLNLVEIRPSRIDLCCDVLMPGDLWREDLMQYRVTRAVSTKTYHHNEQLEGLGIGKGKLQVRFYDKPLEIQKQSHKTWMFDIWGLSEVPEGKRIIRVEFQIRRDVLKQLGINSLEALFSDMANVWAYCTQNWLRFDDRPGLHTVQRTTLPWWQSIQDGFQGIQGASPSIREKAYKIDRAQLVQQTTGFLSSLMAAEIEERNIENLDGVTIKDCLALYLYEYENSGKGEVDLKDRIEKKRARYQRTE